MSRSIADVVDILAEQSNVTGFESLLVEIKRLLPVDGRQVVQAIIAVEQTEAETKKTVADESKDLLRRQAAAVEGVAQKMERLLGLVDAANVETATPRDLTEGFGALKSIRNIAKILQREADLVKAIAELDEQLRTNQFKIKKRTRASPEGRLFTLEVQRDAKRQEVARRIQDALPQTPMQRFLSGTRLGGNWITTGEWSGVLNQAGMTTLPEALKFFVSLGTKGYLASILKQSFAAQMSAEGEAKANAYMTNHPRFDLYTRNGLDFIKSDGDLTNAEDAARSAFLERVPIAAGFQRFFRTFLNLARFQHADAMAMVLGPNPTDAEVAPLMGFANIASGRGNIKSAQGKRWMSNLADILFAPNFYVSRLKALGIGINELAVRPIRQGIALVVPGMTVQRRTQVQKIIAKQYFNYMVSYGVILGILTQLMEDEELETDPRSSDFMQIRIGRARTDISSGFRQWIVVSSRILTGGTKTQGGDIVSFRSATGGIGRPLETILGLDPPDRARSFGGRDFLDITSDFLRSKSSPAVGVGISAFGGTDFLGREQTLGQLAGTFAFPITYRDIYDVATTEMGVDQKTALSVLAMFGGFVNVFDDPSKIEERRR